jgi:DNA repair exonuclease SbcCD ATPase subunit
VEVHRHRKHHLHKDKLLLFVDGREITGPTNRDTQGRIEQILQMDAVAFRSVAMFPQGAAGFADGTDAQQKEILETVLSLERFSRAHQAKKLVAGKLQADITVEETRLADAHRRRDEHAQEMSAMREKQTEFVAWKAQAADAARQKLREAEARQPAVDDTLETKLAELATGVEKAKHAQAVIDQATSALSARNQQLGRLEGQIATAEQLLAEGPGAEPEKPEFPTSHYGEQAEASHRDMLRAQAEAGAVATGERIGLTA